MIFSRLTSVVLATLLCLPLCGISAQGGESSLLFAEFETAISTPERSNIVPLSLVDDPCLTQLAPVPANVGRASAYSGSNSNAGCPPTCCYRGYDHLGELAGCDKSLVNEALAVPVRVLHEAFEFVYHLEAAIDNSTAAAWVKPGPSAARCAHECKWVNWRHGSMYLRGCMPEGYDLFYTIENARHVDFHQGPLHANGNVETGGDHMEATLIDGNDAKPITQVVLSAEPPAGDLPHDRAAEKFVALETRTHLPGTHRDWDGTSFYWNASQLNHQPLYFEDVNLEQHGFSYGFWQPMVSGAKFFATLPALPYLMTAQPQHTTQYALGETRPGNHACYVHELPPVSLDGAAVQAGIVTGLIFLIP